MSVSGEHPPEQRAVINEVAPHAPLLDVASKWCERLLALPHHALAMTKPPAITWEQALTMEEVAEPNCFTTAPFARAVGSLPRA